MRRKISVHVRLKKVCNKSYQCALLIVFLVFLSVANAQQPGLIFNSATQAHLLTETQDGFLDQLTREALRRIGYQLTIERLPAERALRSANMGIIDGEIIRIKGIEKIYKNLVRVPEKMIDMEFVVISKQNIDLRNGWNSLAGKTVAFIRGWKILEKNVPPTALVTRVNNADKLFSLINNNRVELIIYESLGGNFIINKMNLDNVKIQSPPLASREMFMYLNKKHLALVPGLAQQLVDMKKDGSYKKLQSDYQLGIKN